MDFYFDENLPPRIAHAFDALEGKDGHRVYHTQEVWGQGIKDVDLYPKLKAANGILVTNDLKMISRRNEFSLLKELQITAFIMSFPKGSTFDEKARHMFLRWAEIKDCLGGKLPVIYEIKNNGKFIML